MNNYQRNGFPTLISILFAILVISLIIRIAWPLIVALAVGLFICFILSVLRQRQLKNEAAGDLKRELARNSGNIVEGEYREK